MITNNFTNTTSDNPLVNGQPTITATVLSDGTCDRSTTNKSPQSTYNAPRTDIGNLPEHEQDAVRRKLEYVQGALASYTNPDIKNIHESIIQTSIRINDKKAPSEVSVYRWVKKYIDSGNNLKSLMNFHYLKGNKNKTIDNIIWATVDQCIKEAYEKSAVASIQHIYDNVEKKIKFKNQQRDTKSLLKTPSYQDVRRRIKKLGEYKIDCFKHGERRANIKHRVSQHHKQATRPLERFEMDHAQIDLFVVDDDTLIPLGRPYITLIIDCYTRMVCGMHISFQHPGYLAVMNCLYHAMQPKTYVSDVFPKIQHSWPVYGKPETLVVDNGPEFINSDMQDVCNQLGIHLALTRPYEPWMKGKIERFFKTLNTRLLHNIPGNSEVAKLKQYCGPKFNPQKHAIVTMDMLMEMLHKFIIDEYHFKNHAGLLDTPWNMWNMGVDEYGIIPTKVKEDELLVLLGRCTTRKITDNGIQFENIFYNSKELQKYRNTIDLKSDVRIKYNPDNLGVVNVENINEGTYMTIPATNQEYADRLSLYQHQVIRRFKKQNMADNKNLSISDIDAKRTVTKIVKTSISSMKVAYKKRIACFMQLCQQRYDTDYEAIDNDDLDSAVIKYDNAITSPNNSIVLKQECSLTNPIVDEPENTPLEPINETIDPDDVKPDNTDDWGTF